MKPESKGLAPAGRTTSLGFCTIVGSASTEWSVAALFTHSIVCPTLIVTFSGRNLGGLSLILITMAGPATAGRANIMTAAATINTAAPDANAPLHKPKALDEA